MSNQENSLGGIGKSQRYSLSYNYYLKKITFLTDLIKT